MKILMIGDVSSRVGRDALFEFSERGFFGADLVIANAENAAHGRGVTRNVFDELSRTGVDGFTLGNHIWDSSEIINILRYNDNIIRPYNLEGELPGEGYMILKTASGIRVGVLNLIGRVNISMPLSANPFLAADRALEKMRGKCDVIAVDFHAEATSEKLALGYYLDGRVGIVAGTHTHVQTADAHIMPKGTGYITDLGMTGPAISVLGMDRKNVIDRFCTNIPRRLDPATGRGQFCGCLFEISEKTGLATEVRPIFEKL